MNQHAIDGQFIGGGQVGALTPTVSPTSATVNQGGTLQLTTTNFTGGAVTWASSNNLVATVGGSGLVTITGPGSATITATGVTNTGQAASCAITVPAVTIAISPTTSNLGFSGSQQFTAVVSGTVNTTVTWSETGGLSVSGTGLFTALATAGSATVTATSVANPSASASATVTVSAVTTFLSAVKIFAAGLGSAVGYQVYSNGVAYGSRISGPAIVERPSGTYSSPTVIAPSGTLVQVEWDNGSGLGFGDFAPQFVAGNPASIVSAIQSSGVTLTPGMLSILAPYVLITGTTNPPTADLYYRVGIYYRGSGTGAPYYQGIVTGNFLWTDGNVWNNSSTAPGVTLPSQYFQTAAGVNVLGPYAPIGSGTTIASQALSFKGNAVLEGLQPSLTMALNGVIGWGTWTLLQTIRAIAQFLFGLRAAVPTAGTAGTVTYTGPASVAYGSVAVDASGDVTSNNLTPPL